MPEPLLHRRNLLVAGVAVMALVLTAGVVAANPPANTDRLQVDAPGLLAEAEASLPFDVPELSTTALPLGFRLDNVMWSMPSSVTGETAASVDVWYSNAADDRIHLWMTNDQDMGEKDPMNVGHREVWRGLEWAVAEDRLGPYGQMVTVFTARLADGTTLSVDAPFDHASTLAMLLSVQRDGIPTRP